MGNPMKTIVITSQKGGSGKTTLAAQLSVAAERAKDGPVVLIDTDIQNTLTTWWNLRETDTPQFAEVTLRTLENKLADLATAGFAYCFIDTPPALTDQNEDILKLADMVLIPSRPTPADLWSLGATIDLVNKAGVPFAFVLTQAKGNAKLTLQTGKFDDRDSAGPVTMKYARGLLELEPRRIRLTVREAVCRLRARLGSRVAQG